jgi:hypothetical protein
VFWENALLDYCNQAFKCHCAPNGRSNVFHFPIPSAEWLALSFAAGFISVRPFASLIIQKLFSPLAPKEGWPNFGIKIGALCGFINALVLAFLHLAIYFSAWIYDGPDTEGLMRFFSAYLRISAILSGPFAALIDAGTGAGVELFLRKHSLEAPPASAGR